MQKEITTEEKKDIRNLALVKEVGRQKAVLRKEYRIKRMLIILCGLFMSLTILFGLLLLNNQQITKFQVQEIHEKNDSLAFMAKRTDNTNKLLKTKIDSLLLTSYFINDVDNQFKIQLGAFRNSNNTLEKKLSMHLVYEENASLYKFHIIGFQSENEAKVYLNEIRKLKLQDAFIVQP